MINLGGRKESVAKREVGEEGLGTRLALVGMLKLLTSLANVSYSIVPRQASSPSSNNIREAKRKK